MKTSGSKDVSTRLKPDLGEVINIKYILQMLWNGKWVMITSICFFMTMSFVVSSSDKEVWTSTAKVTVPATHDALVTTMYVEQFKPGFGKFYSDATLFKDENVLYVDSGSVNAYADLSEAANSDTLFGNFVSIFNSNTTKAEFLRFKEKNEGENPIVYSMKASFSDREKRNAIVVSKSASGEMSQKNLMEYVEFVNEKQKEALLSKVKSLLDFYKFRLEGILKEKEVLALEKKRLVLEEISLALSIVEPLGIDKPLVDLYYEPDLPIALGSEILKKKFEKISEIKDLGMVDPTIGRIKIKISMLGGDSYSLEKARFTSYVSKPSNPGGHDKKRMSKLLMIGFILGAMIGISILLLVNLSRSARSSLK
ncbi:Wzz/FepE/Etk N-terminal domain-containing protein [Enterovibrio makurazakiensis]|uniref:Wzz/FepE/Etk N-terminal domain-containing protein n=1 Tax=Enterovibrio makurazakiensis TaxID=2910232 RepID=UPI003D1A6F92